jgi:DNA-binding XRE family transcriptional regulator
MIVTAVVDEIRALLAKGELSQRRIAQRLGVSRGTVNAIARGKRRDQAIRCRAFGTDFALPNGPPTRCPGCGGKVHMPCLLCRIRAIKHRGRFQGRPFA